MWKEVDQRIRRALNGVRLAFRGVGSSTTSSGPVQTMQGEGLAGEQIQGNELFQHFGFTSRPPAGYQFVALPVGGQTSHAIIIATEHGDYRLKTLQPGEVALYDAFGTSVILKQGRVAEVNCARLVVNADTEVQFNTPLIKASGALVVDRDITDRAAYPDAGTMRGMRAVYDGHTHPENDNGGPTGTPNQPMTAG